MLQLIFLACLRSLLQVLTSVATSVGLQQALQLGFLKEPKGVRHINSSEVEN